MVPAVVMMLASRPFLFDVRDLTIGRELPVVTGNATAPEVRKAEETDAANTADAAARWGFCRIYEQFLYLNVQRRGFRTPATPILTWTPAVSQRFRGGG